MIVKYSLFLESLNRILKEDHEYGFNLSIGDVSNNLSVLLLSNVYNAFFKGKLSKAEYDKMFPENVVPEIEMLYINPKDRKKGYATLLVNEAIKHVKELGYSSIYVDVMPFEDDGEDEINNGLNNEDLIDFYKKFGFEFIYKNKEDQKMLLKLK